MNRIQSLIEDEQDSILRTAACVAEMNGGAEGEHDETHCIFTPMHYERNYAYPLVVWLHGPDDDERQVTRVMPLISARNYVAVGPRGTLASRRAPEAYDWSQTSRHVALAEQRVFSAVASARRWLNVAPYRVFLAGYGAGGTMALRIGLNQPRAFAGALSIGGPFPTTDRPLSRLHDARKLKIFLTTARDSREYPEADVCRHLRLFHAAGMSVDLRQYPCGDELTTNMLSDMDRWIMRQFTETAPAAHDQAGHRSHGL
jgi:phospholipase/carboxylesterase